MNKLLKVFTVFLVGLIGYACSPEEHELASASVDSDELVEGIAFNIEHDAENPNIIYLTSLMDGRFTPLWDHPQGRSQAQKVTLKMPFPGTYTVKFGVQTRGGAVFGADATFTVDDFHAPFVEDPLWKLLSGGVDHEKTWYLDLDAEQVSRNFLGPLYFYGTNDSWLSVTDHLVVGGDSWNWTPDYKGNSWMMTAADFGSMTFDLKGAANVTVVHNTIAGRGTETGTYLLDADAKTMRMTDASPLHDSNRDGVVVDWGNIKILSLTENFMQLAVLRDPALSGEGACLLVYNFISKDYYDNWVPGEVAEPEPPYNGNPNEDLTTTVATKKKWAMSLNTPYNWAGLDGGFLNTWNSPADYAATGWAPYDASLIANISLTLDKTGATTGDYEFTDGGGNIIDGSYTIDATNHIVFDKAISINASGWVNMETTPEHKLRLIRTDVDAFGNISKIWLGKRDPIKPEYQVFGFEPVAGGGGEPADNSVEIPFNNSKLAFGDLEGNGNFRLEMYNDFGSTAANPPLDKTLLVFSNQITVTFTLSGITFSGGDGTYDAKLSLADGDWSPQYWGDGPGNTVVTGNGTYTVTYTPPSTSDGAVVFLIDIVGMSTDITNLAGVTATIDSIKIK